MSTISGIPHWDEAPDLYDTCTIAGVALPGLVKIAGTLSRKLDKKNAKGADGATITDDGANAAEIELSVIMWDAGQWTAYQELLPLINPIQTKGKLSPVDVVHPVLALHGIRSVYVEEVTLPQAGNIPQTREFKIKLVEWRPAPKTPKPSKSVTPTKALNNPLDLVYLTSSNLMAETIFKTDLGPIDFSQPGASGGTQPKTEEDGPRYYGLEPETYPDP
jgi:hypothetical protein